MKLQILGYEMKLKLLGNVIAFISLHLFQLPFE